MPSDTRPVILLTRPAEDSRRFAAMLPSWPVVISPILRIVPVAHDARRLEIAEGLVFTSAHAVASAGPGRGRPAICVGARTADVARRAGFEVSTGNGFAESLLPLIAAAPVALVHPHGRHLARKLPVEGIVVYDQLEQPLSDAARAALDTDGTVILPLFSPRSARLVSAAVAGARARLWPVAISPAAMAAWGAADRHAIAATPDMQAMAAAIVGLAAAEQS